MLRRLYLAAWCLLILMAMSQPASALVRDDLLFYAPLNGSLKAQIAAGRAEPVKADASPRFVDGRNGSKGLLTGGPGSEVKYSLARNLDLQAGSVAMWVKPVDWSVDGNMRFFFSMSANPSRGDDGNFIWLYKFFNYSVFWLTQQDSACRQYFVVSPAAGDRGGRFAFQWQAGRWDHLLATWSGNQIALYINGRYCGNVYLPTQMILKQAKEFVIGGQNRRDGGKADTVICEVMILRRPVTPAEARAIYDSGLAALAPVDGRLSDPLLEPTAGYIPGTDQIAITANLMGRRPDELNSLQMSYDVADESGKTVLTGSGKVRALEQRFLANGKSLPLGAYTVSVQLKDADQVVGRGSCRFDKLPKPQWLGNALGKPDKVPAPFTNLEQKGNSLACWGRTYSWTEVGLMGQVVSQGQPLLAAPVTLRAVVNGEPCTLSNVKSKWTQINPARCIFELSGQLGKVVVKAKGWIEYDGFVWYEIGLPAGANAVIDRLAIEIPLRPQAATLMQGRDPISRLGDGGRIQAVHGRPLAARVYWVGNEDVGLQWSTDTAHDNRLNDLSRTVEIVPGPDVVMCRLSLIDHSVTTTQPLSYTLGLHATPVKPFPSGWRKWEAMLNKVNCGPNGKTPAWQFWWDAWNKVRREDRGGPYGYNLVSNPKLTDGEISMYRRTNVRPWMYWHERAIWKADPALKVFGAEWGDSYDEQALKNPWTDTKISHEYESMRDLKVWRALQVLQDNPRLAEITPGYYLDVCQSAWMPHCYPDGQTDLRYDMLGTRDLQKRFYNAYKCAYPDKLVSNHQSGDFHMFQMAFSDMYLTGEHLCLSLTRESDYHGVITYDSLRAAYNGEAMGLPVIFLPQPERAVGDDKSKRAKIKGPEGIPISEHLAGMLWVHDIIPWYMWLNPQPFIRIGKIKEQFGTDDQTHFVGYWQSQKFLRQTGGGSAVVTSLFTRPGKILLVTMNDADHDVLVDLKIDFKALGLTEPKTLVDVYAKECGQATAVPVTNGHVSVTIPQRNFRALLAE